MFQLFGDEDDAELSTTGPSEAEMIKQRTAAAEDVVILEVEEGVPELQRLTLLLRRGQPLQKLSALESLSRTVREHEASACDPLLQLVASVLAESSLDESCQEAAAVGLGELGLLLEPAMVELRVLPTMLKALQAGADACGAASSSQSLPDAVSDDVLKAWLRSLVTLVEAGRLSADAIRRTVLPFALAQGEAARPVVSRMVCCHVLGAAAAGYGEAGGICEQGTVAHALALCQDTEACVRACMGLQLVRLGAALGPQRASGNLLTELMELTRDEQPEVRASAFASGAALLRCTEATARRAQLEPALRALLLDSIHSVEAVAERRGARDSGSPPLRRSSSSTSSTAMPAAPELLTAVAEHLPTYLQNLLECGALPPSKPFVPSEHAAAATAVAADAAAPAPVGLDEAESGVGALAERLVGLLAHFGGPELRAAAARGLPSLASCCGADAAARAQPVLTRLLADPMPAVQAAAAAALLPLARALGPLGAQTLLLPLLPSLLGEASSGAGFWPAAPREGLPALSSHSGPMRCLVDLPELIGAMAGAAAGAEAHAAAAAAAAMAARLATPEAAAAADAAAADAAAAEGGEAGVCARLLPALIELDGRLSPSHWRTSHALLSSFAVLVRCLDPAVLHAQLLPALLRHTAPAAPAPNRQLAVRLLCQLHRRLRSTAQRAELCAWLVRELGQGRSYQQRLLYLDACALLLGDDGELACSRALFKAQGMHFPATDLATDPVSNVRLKLCGLLLPLKRTLRLPADAQALELLHLGTVALQADLSRDVRAAAAAVQPALASVEVLTEGAARRATAAGGGARREALEAVLQAEEEALRSQEERASAERERQQAAGGARRRRNSRDALGMPPGFDPRGAPGAASATSIEGAIARARGPSTAAPARGGVPAEAPGAASRRRRGSKDLLPAPTPTASSNSRLRRGSKDALPSFS